MKDYTRKNIFISYSSSDTQWATWIASVLERNGFSVFVGAWDLRPGDDFVTKANEAIQNADVFMPLLSEAYSKSVYCSAEFGMAFGENASKRIKLIPVRVANTTPTGILATIIYVDLYGKFEEEEAEKRLLLALETSEVERIEPRFPGEIKMGDSLYPGDLPPNNLPARNSFFTGRDNNLTKISIAFKDNKIVQITGIGGIGKTQLALEYAYRFGYLYSSVIWFIQATDANTLTNSLIHLCKEVGIDTPENCTEYEIIAKTKKWLEANESWLLIIDDPSDIDEIHTLTSDSLCGHVLITTRDKNTNFGFAINVGVLSDSEALDFVTAQLSGMDLSEAHSLVAQLGFYPLALEQATAYIKNTNITIPAFLTILAENTLSSKIESQNAFDQTMAMMLSTTLSVLSTEAKQLLSISSYFSVNTISCSLFMRNRDLLPNPLKDALGTDYGFSNIIGELLNHALIEGNTQEYRVHPYYQGYIRFLHENGKEWLIIATRIFLSEIPREFKEFESKERFIHASEHAMTVADYLLRFSEGDMSIITTIDYTEISELYFRLGCGYRETMQYDKSIKAFEKSLGLSNFFESNNYADMALTYNNMAQGFDAEGRQLEAIELYNKALEIYIKSLGTEHPSVAAAYVNIAAVYNRRREYDSSLQYYGGLCQFRREFLE